MRTCTRKLEFDAAHRIMRHGSKCVNLHGHRYVAEVTVAAAELDDLSMVVDFSVVKQVIGGWLDEHWDHGMIANERDENIIAMCRYNGWKVYTLDAEPTVEVMADVLLRVSNELIAGRGLEVVKIRLYETPNCWADV